MKVLITAIAVGLLVCVLGTAALAGKAVPTITVSPSPTTTMTDTVITASGLPKHVLVEVASVADPVYTYSQEYTTVNGSLPDDVTFQALPAGAWTVTIYDTSAKKKVIVSTTVESTEA